MKKVGRLQLVWLQTSCLLQVMRYCFRVLMKIFTGTLTLEYERNIIVKRSKKLLRTIHADVKIVNPNNVAPKANEPTIIMCNHTSLLDIPISYLAFPNHNIRMLAKKELAKIPIMGYVMKKLRYPFIDRKNRAQAMQDLKQLKELLDDGYLIWIAPEGTRSRDGKLHPFKKGGFITAIQTGATIIPIGIRGAYNILPKHTFQASINCNVEVHIGDSVDSKQYTLENKDELIDVVYREMKQLVGEV